METGLSIKIIFIIVYIICNLIYSVKMDTDYTDNNIIYNAITIITSIIFLPGLILFCINILIKKILF